MSEQIKLTKEQKLDLAAWIANENDGLITGSLMLHRRGIDLGREPEDIDILIEPTSPDDLILPPLCDKIVIEDDEEGYPVLLRCYFFGTKIEFMEDVGEDFDLAYVRSGNGHYKSKSPFFKFAKVENLLKAKKHYVEHDCFEGSREKHDHDIKIIEQWLLNNKINEKR